ncbi:MAG: hypothetical protein JNK05_30845 [Myxococcales bacterium]|nr:hypothetical protein [Myxococcales bacterium]
MARSSANKATTKSSTKKPVSKAASPHLVSAKSRSKGPPPRALCGVDLRTAGEKFLAPTRPKLALAQEALASITDPAEAWEALAARDVVPLSWVSHPTRQVVVDGVKCPRCRDPFVGHTRKCPRAAVPATVAAALTLASDPATVETVESLALEAFARIRRNADRPRRVIWRVVGGDYPSVLYRKRPAQILVSSPHGTIIEAGDALAKSAGIDGRWWSVAGPRTMYYGGIDDAELARRGYVPNHYALAMAYRADAMNFWSWENNSRKRSEDNPFAPLCEAWLLGYAIDGVEEDEIVLLALDASVSRPTLLRFERDGG